VARHRAIPSALETGSEVQTNLQPCLAFESFFLVGTTLILDFVHHNAVPANGRGERGSEVFVDILASIGAYL